MSFKILQLGYNLYNLLCITFLNTKIVTQNTIVVVEDDEEVAENAYGDDDDVIIDCTSIFEDGDEIENAAEENATEGKKLYSIKQKV